MLVKIYLAAVMMASLAGAGSMASASKTTYDINTLAGKVASLNGTAGLQIRFSGYVEQEAQVESGSSSVPAAPISPTFVLSSPLDETTVVPPDVTVNQDTMAAPQNETAIAVDPNNPDRLVAGANDYVPRTWSCVVDGVPCSALGDGYSGTYFSNDGGEHWCCTSTDPQHLGTLVPGIEKLAGGIYDAGGDPAVAFDSRGNAYYAGLGFDRTAPPNTVTLSKGTFNASGDLVWGSPTFIDQTTSPAIFNDKEWLAVDSYVNSPFRDRVYVTFTRFIFNPHTGAYVQSPIAIANSTDGGKTFSKPRLIVGNVLYDQGSRPVVAPDGTLYVFFEGATRLATLNSTYVVKSTDGGVTFSKPIAISQLVDISPLPNTLFRVNSFPAAAVAPNGDVYVTWNTLVDNSTGKLCSTFTYNGCHSAAVYSMSTDGGMTWSPFQLDFPAVDASTQTAEGYPVKQPDGSMLNAPATLLRVDQVFPAVAVSPSGKVYMSAYIADFVSPWQTCQTPASPTSVGRIDCLTLGKFIDNARLDYEVSDLTSNVASTVTTHHINTQYGFGGGFFGDYTDIAVGSNNVFHAFWTDSNNQQDVIWFYGYEFAAGTKTNQQDVVVYNGGY
ncbi:MAG: glycoside hydrolase [Chloroflexi bacterium]|nr:glycoside hydrolase [Chloroflexota bacterium]